MTSLEDKLKIRLEKMGNADSSNNAATIIYIIIAIAYCFFVCIIPTCFKGDIGIIGTILSVFFPAISTGISFAVMWLVKKSFNDRTKRIYGILSFAAFIAAILLCVLEWISEHSFFNLVLTGLIWGSQFVGLSSWLQDYIKK